jgi:hypothetical protein
MVQGLSWRSGMGRVPRQSRNTFFVIWKKQNSFGASRRMWPHNYDHHEWSRTGRCQIHREYGYGLCLHPPVLGDLGCNFQPLAEQNVRADLQSDDRVPVSTVLTFDPRATLNPQHHPRATAATNSTRRSTDFPHLSIK